MTTHETLLPELLTACKNILFAMSEPITKRGTTQLREEAIEEIRVLVAKAHEVNQ